MGRLTGQGSWKMSQLMTRHSELTRRFHQPDILRIGHLEFKTTIGTSRGFLKQNSDIAAGPHPNSGSLRRFTRPGTGKPNRGADLLITEFSTYLRFATEKQPDSGVRRWRFLVIPVVYRIT